MSRSWILGAVSLAAATALVPAGAAGEDQRAPKPIYQTVAKGLHNPRQLRFSSTGALYVAEAGRGGQGPCLVGGEGVTVCFGTTGSVTRVFHGHQRRVLTGIASLANRTDGGFAIGPSDLAVHRHTLVLSVGLGLAPARRSRLPRLGRREMADLLSFDLRTGRRRLVGDLDRHEAKTNPVDNPDTDPTGLAPAGRLGYVVTDSGGNTLVRADQGVVRGVAKFRDRTIHGTTYQSVPTDVAKGPDGAWYVSELTGAPFTPGVARIWRVVPGHRPRVWASGLTNVTSLAWAKGRLYAVQISDSGIATGFVGSLLQVHPDKSGKRDRTIARDLPAPYGVAVRRGAAYVSIGAIDPTGGSVIRVPLP
jgi:hypothetical protein